MPSRWVAFRCYYYYFFFPFFLSYFNVPLLIVGLISLVYVQITVQYSIAVVVSFKNHACRPAAASRRIIFFSSEAYTFAVRTEIVRKSKKIDFVSHDR